MPWTAPADVGAVRYLEESLRSGRMAHAYLLSGPPGVGVLALARQMAQALLCQGPEPPCGACRHCRRVAAGTHADLVVLKPTGVSGAILIDAVREMRAFATLQPFEAHGRVLIIDGAEAMTRDAANALLKLLEEPPPGVTLLLTTADEEAVLETVRSRCQPLRLRPLPFRRVAEVLQQQGVGPEEAERLARLSGGRLEAALSLAQDAGPLKERQETLTELTGLAHLGPAARLRRAGEMAETFFRDREGLYARLELWASLWRDALFLAAGATEGIPDPSAVPSLRGLAASVADAAKTLTEVRATAEALRRNANPRLALEALLLSLPRT
ncbi:MAG: DNA polymerase III subunit delta' [Chloroflexi bacterium]|nr:DNA polymerase III subunit delta' [Chloroflexota bacterium]